VRARGKGSKITVGGKMREKRKEGQKKNQRKNGTKEGGGKKAANSKGQGENL